MREESHLDDMRSAIRGDFERLAERRGGQELMSVDDEPPEPDVAELTPEPEPAVEPDAELAVGSEPERDSEPATEPVPEPVSDDRHASWLDRLLGR
ncbi:MAG TPA: hypothetical protein VFG70_06855 [Gaiellaceae bacterium]|nr:hypothetical protein [Gaiellaceae bacterium]